MMVDELLKMIAECHLQKPQTTSKFGNLVARMLKYLAKNKYHIIPWESHYCSYDACLSR